MYSHHLFIAWKACHLLQLKNSRTVLFSVKNAMSSSVKVGNRVDLYFTFLHQFIALL